MVASGEGFEFSGIFDLFLGRLDPESLGESGVSLSLRTFGNALKLYRLS